jgi:hypothetical protein
MTSVINIPTILNDNVNISGSIKLQDISLSVLDISGSLLINNVENVLNVNVDQSLNLRTINLLDNLNELSNNIMNYQSLTINNLNVYDTIIDLCSNTGINSEHLQMEKVDISDEILFKDDIEISGNMNVIDVSCNRITKLKGHYSGYKDTIEFFNSSTTSYYPDLSNTIYIDSDVYEINTDKTIITVKKTGYYKCSYTFSFLNNVKTDNKRQTYRVTPLHGTINISQGISFGYTRRGVTLDGIRCESCTNTFIVELSSDDTLSFKIDYDMEGISSFGDDFYITSVLLSDNTYNSAFFVIGGNVILEYLYD